MIEAIAELAQDVDTVCQFAVDHYVAPQQGLPVAVVTI